MRSNLKNMKKIKFTLLLVLAAGLLFFFTQCEKERGGSVKLSCYFIEASGDTVGPISNVFVYADTTRISPYDHVDTLINNHGDTLLIPRTNYTNADLANARGYTGADGSITFNFAHPILLNLLAVDTLRDVNGQDSLIYNSVQTQVQITDGDVLEAPIYLYPVF